MVTVAGLVIVVTVMVSGADEGVDQPVTITMVAASATQEGGSATEKKSYGGMVKSMVPSNDKKPRKHFDKELKEIEEAVADLPYDTFRKVNIVTQRVSMDEDAEFEINPTFTLHAKPLEWDRKNRVRMDLRIDEKVEVEDKDTKEKKSVVRKALSTTSAVAPGTHLCLGGPKLEEGKLVVVLSVEPAN